MIVDKFLDLVFLALTQVLQLIPVIPVPNWQGAGSEFAQVLAAASTMGVWIPVGLALQLAGLLMFCLTGGLMVKVGRMFLSLISGGGGGAG